MNDYSQPDFYRFNEDSLKLVKFVVSKLKSAERILDLGAGCGVMGIEIANALSARELCLVEFQGDYLPHIELNLFHQLKITVSAETYIQAFSTFFPERMFDLIVCNPPYFKQGHGKVSPDPRRQLARTFIEDSWKELFSCIERSLLPQGHAYLVIRKDPAVFSEFEKENIKIYEEHDLLFLELAGLDIK